MTLTLSWTSTKCVSFDIDLIVNGTSKGKLREHELLVIGSTLKQINLILLVPKKERNLSFSESCRVRNIVTIFILSQQLFYFSSWKVLNLMESWEFHTSGLSNNPVHVLFHVLII